MRHAINDVLSSVQIEESLQSSPEWKFKTGKLIREWSFRDFAQSMEFVGKVAALAGAIGHHPEISIQYHRVLLTLVSHDVGGVTRRDLDMARQIDRLV
ncbi:MAG: 4a-hydroxytetrahydrobiopterin dehydratase [Acidobacteriota bacterium]|nr:4a-hydroxytetrahydrobiopterin dehydratase [Acidobacteriota bacterium]